MFKKTLIASAVLAASFGAHAAGSAGFGVTGTITPNTCNITLTGNGLADYGTLPSATVRTYEVYQNVYILGNREVPISVVCPSPMRVQLAFVDNKSAQRLAVDSADWSRFGIADGSGTTAIGAYKVSMNSVTIDGAAPAGYLRAPNGTATWTTPDKELDLGIPGRATGFKKAAGAAVPAALTTLGGNLTIRTNVSKAYVDAAKSEIRLNGSGTINLQYL